MSTSSSSRARSDLKKLMKAGFEVALINQDINHFNVLFHGPEDSPYAGGKWKVGVRLPHDYPFKSPSIGFRNTIFHPNIDERSGSVCLDVLNQTWTPMYDLFNVFSSFLPQLLLYPNPSDPLNGTAASLNLTDKRAFDKRVKEYVEKFAQAEIDLETEDKPLKLTATPPSSLSSNASSHLGGMDGLPSSIDEDGDIAQDDDDDGDSSDDDLDDVDLDYDDDGDMELAATMDL